MTFYANVRTKVKRGSHNSALNGFSSWSLQRTRNLLRIVYLLWRTPNEVDNRRFMSVMALDFAFPTCNHSWNPIKFHPFSYAYCALALPSAQPQRRETTLEGNIFLGGNAKYHFLCGLTELNEMDWHWIGPCVSVLRYALLKKAGLGEGRKSNVFSCKSA